MKKIFICYILFCLVPLFGLAQNKPKGNTRLSVSTNNISIAHSGEETRFSVSCNVNYSVSSSNSWLHVYKSGDYIRVVCDANYSLSSRTGQIMVKTDNGVKTESVAVCQYGKPNSTLLLSTAKVTDTGVGGTIKITVSTNAPYWGIKNVPYWCSYKDKTTNSFTLVVSPNTLTSTRIDSFSVYAGDAEKTIVVEQAQRRDYAGENTNAQGLSLTKTSITCSSSGTTEYITVNSNRAWEIQFPTGGMYSATRNGNTIKVVITANPTSTYRSDFFEVRLVDKSQSIRVNVWQSAPTTSPSSVKRSSSTSKHSKSNRSASRKSAYPRYLNVNGKTEITWYGLSAAIGTGVSTTHSLMRVRTRRFEVRPVDVTIGYDFIGGNVNFAYHPLFSCYIPTSSDKAMYLGAGPSCVISNGDAAWWIRAEVGLHWKWGNYASSDFFVRYDGMYTAGVSMQWSSAWWQ